MFLVNDHVLMTVNQRMYLRSSWRVMKMSVRRYATDGSRFAARKEIDEWFAACDQVAHMLRVYDETIDQLDSGAPLI